MQSVKCCSAHDGVPEVCCPEQHASRRCIGGVSESLDHSSSEARMLALTRKEGRECPAPGTPGKCDSSLALDLPWEVPSPVFCKQLELVDDISFVFPRK